MAFVNGEGILRHLSIVLACFETYCFANCETSAYLRHAVGTRDLIAGE